MRKQLKFLSALVVAALLLSMVACKKGADLEVEPGPDPRFTVPEWHEEVPRRENQVNISLGSSDITNERLAEMVSNGEIPADTTTLGLSNNQISDISPLSALTYLESLNLNGNGVSDLTPLAGLVNLNTLQLNNNQVNDISPLTDMPLLMVLYLANNQVADVTALNGKSRLTHLNFHNNPLSASQIDTLKATLRDTVDIVR